VHACEGRGAWWGGSFGRGWLSGLLLHLDGEGFGEFEAEGGLGGQDNLRLYEGDKGRDQGLEASRGGCGAGGRKEGAPFAAGTEKPAPNHLYVFISSSGSGPGLRKGE
jgi:hypothetical protein